jgi:hypothetical protein
MPLVQINAAAVKGEPGTGFEKRAAKGPFECGNCHYFKNGNACHEENMKKKSKQPRHKDGSVVVAADDCCEYVERVGREGKGFGSLLKRSSSYGK